jgi:hypothetical protein
MKRFDGLAAAAAQGNGEPGIHGNRSGRFRRCGSRSTC